MYMSEDFLKKLIENLFSKSNLKIKNFNQILSKKNENLNNEMNSDSDSDLDLDTDLILDFSKPFKKIDFCEKLEEILGEKLPNFNIEKDSVEKLLKIFSKYSIVVPKPVTLPKLLDKLASHFLEPLCIQPTFIINHPTPLSPLAKSHENQPFKTERFELFICGIEFFNGYSELNDPKEQRKRFLLQQKDSELGDEEAQILDEDFCKALEYGLTPTAGLGIGLDRLCMLLTDQSSIKEVILFPTVRPILKSQDKEKETENKK